MRRLPPFRRIPGFPTGPSLPTAWIAALLIPGLVAGLAAGLLSGPAAGATGTGPATGSSPAPAGAETPGETNGETPGEATTETTGETRAETGAETGPDTGAHAGPETAAPPEGGPSSFERAAEYSEARRGEALLVWRDGERVFEAHHGRFGAGQAHRLFSGTKTFAGLLAVAAAEDGLLELDEPAAETLTEWAGDGERSRITVRQLVQLTSGLETTVGRAPDFAEAVGKPLVHAPGEGFRYGATGFQAFGALLQRKLGKEGVLEYLQRRILDPLGVEADGWGTTAGGDPNLASGAVMTAGDWLRVGRLLVQEGRWEGRPVLKPASLRELTRPAPAAPGYGLGVWLNGALGVEAGEETGVTGPGSSFIDQLPPRVTPDGPGGMILDGGPPDLFMAAGAANQRLYLVPSRGLAVVRLGRADPRWDDGEMLARLLETRTAAELDPEQAFPPSLEEITHGEGTRAARLAWFQLALLDNALELDRDQEVALLPLLIRRLEAHFVAERERADADAGAEERRRTLRQLQEVERETYRQMEKALYPEQVEPFRELVERERAGRPAWKNRTPEP